MDSHGGREPQELMTRRNSNSWTIGAICMIAAIWLASCPSAFAQDDEEPIMAPPPHEMDTIMSPREACVENFGYMGCGPEGNPLTQQQNNQGNRIVVYWAALAISDKTMKTGASHGENSADSADQTALANCRRNGPTDCKILTQAFDHCMALALGSKRGTYGFSFGADRKSAAAAAMGHCKHAGGVKCAVATAPCPADDPRWSAPLPLPTDVQGGPVDPRMVGTWQLSVNPGTWIWRVASNGTYEFHSEAMDGARANAGTITASQGNYKQHAMNMFFDYAATYTFQGPDTLPDTLTVKGSLGTSTYHRMTPSGH